MQSANERRNQITEYISHNRFFTLQNLMDEFGISKRTAQRDIEFLMSEPYYIPIDSIQGNGGGYHVADGWYASHKYFKPDEADLLHRLTEGLQPKDREIMERIFRTFEMPKNIAGMLNGKDEDLWREKQTWYSSALPTRAMWRRT